MSSGFSVPGVNPWSWDVKIEGAHREAVVLLGELAVDVAALDEAADRQRSRVDAGFAQGRAQRQDVHAQRRRRRRQAAQHRHRVLAAQAAGEQQRTRTALQHARQHRLDEPGRRGNDRVERRAHGVRAGRRERRDAQARGVRRAEVHRVDLAGFGRDAR
jgi:hypothetical protein